MWTKEGDLRSPKKRCRVDQTHQAQRKRSENDNSEVERIVAAKEDDTNRDFHKQLRSISSDDVDSVFHGPLPPEILFRILGYCRAPELLRTERTCKRLMGLLRTSTPDTEEIWKCVVCSYWPWANEITFDESSKSRPPAWRRVFQYLRGLHFSTFAPLENCHINFLPALRTPFMRTTRQNWYTRRSPFSKPSFLSGPAQFPLAIIEECEEEQVLAVIPGVEGNVDLLELSSVSVLVSRMASSTCASSTCGLPPVMDFGFRHIEIDFELCLPEWQAVLVGVVGYDTSTPERSLLLEKGNAWFFDIGELTVPEFYNNDCRCGKLMEARGENSLEPRH